MKFILDLYLNSASFLCGSSKKKGDTQHHLSFVFVRFNCKSHRAKRKYYVTIARSTKLFEAFRSQIEDKNILQLL